MKTNSKMKTEIKFVCVALAALTCVALSPAVQAVVPPPDGGYPNFNTAEGQNALFSLTNGSANTAVGWYSLFSNTDGSYNTAVGAGTLLFNLGNQASGAGTQNTAIGTAALLSNTTGASNTAIGTTALLNNTTGQGNTAIGSLALFNNTSGTFVTALGFEAGSSVTTANNVIAIGTTGENVSDSCYIAHILGATSSAGTAVFINSSGKLGTATSSRRFKEEIKPMAEASEALFALKPVTFRYKKEIDSAGTSQFGLVAEDIEKINPDLVVRDKEGNPYSVRYDQVNAMLLNEFLKEHKTVQEQADTISIVKANSGRQEATIARLEQQIESLTAGLQKVSAQLELSRLAPQTVKNTD
jgi:Chaperone of endosialidase